MEKGNFNLLKIMTKMPWVILFVQVILIVYVLSVFDVVDVTLNKGTIEYFNTGWHLLREDGSSEIVTLPYYEECDADTVIRIVNVIPQKYYGKTLSFLTADKDMTIYMDGEIVYQFGVNDKRTFGHTPGSVTNFVDIPYDLESGEIVIELSSPYENFGASIDSIMVANRDIAIFNMLDRNVAQIISVIIIMISTVVFCVLALTSKWMKQPTDGTEYLAVYCFVAVVFYSIETKALNLIYGNQTLYSIEVFLSLMILPLFMITYYIERFNLWKSKSMKTILYLSVINACVQIPLQFFDIVDFMNMAFVSHAIMFAAIWIMIWNLYIVSKNNRDKSYMLEFVALICVGMCALVDIVRSYTETAEHIEKFSRYGTTLFCFLMLVSHIIQLMRKYVAALEENAELLRQKAILAEQKNAAKSIFLARMSHEIRTPINAVLGMNQMILKGTKEETTREYAEDVDSAAQLLLGIVNEILDLSKIEAGKMTLVESEYALSSVIYDVANMTAIRAHSKNINFVVDIDSKTPEKLYGDDVKLRQILTNILSNAVKYTDEGKVVLTLRSRICDDGENAELTFSISDTGIGIKKEDLPRLFDEFSRFDEQKNKVVEGSGLGMSITVQFLKLMNSELKVESEYGSGSVFSFTVMQRICSEVQIGDFTSHFNGRREKYFVDKNLISEGKKILVVDDNALNRKVFMAQLKDTKLQVDEAESGEKCLELAAGEKYNMIFLDHMMPFMDGIETLKRLRQQENNINEGTPVIALTANVIDGAKEFYLNEGFDGYLSKPVENEALMKLLKRI